MQEAGNKGVKKSVPAILQLMVWRKIQDRKAANMDVGEDRQTDSCVVRRKN